MSDGNQSLVAFKMFVHVNYLVRHVIRIPFSLWWRNLSTEEKNILVRQWGNAVIVSRLHCLTAQEYLTEYRQLSYQAQKRHDQETRVIKRMARRNPSDLYFELLKAGITYRQFERWWRHISTQHQTVLLKIWYITVHQAKNKLLPLPHVTQQSILKSTSAEFGEVVTIS